MKVNMVTSVFALALLASSVRADKRFVESSRPRDAARVTTVRWEEGVERSDLILRDGVPFKILEQDDVTVIASIRDVGKRFRVDVYIYNGGSQRFEIYPERASFVMTSPKVKALEYVPMDKIARSIKRKAAWAAALAGMGANATETVTATTTSSGTVTATDAKSFDRSTASYSGHATTTATVPDYEARAASREAVREIHEQASARLAELSDVALQANTLLPGEEVEGSVFFQKNGDIRSGVVTIPAGAWAFEFPVTLAKVKK